jgi:hypothetical protein
MRNIINLQYLARGSGLPFWLTFQQKLASLSKLRSHLVHLLSKLIQVRETCMMHRSAFIPI